MPSPSLAIDIERALKAFIGAVRVAAAGTLSAKGVYTDRGMLTNSDRKTYNLVGSPDLISGDSVFYHAVTKWSIYDDDGNRLYKQIAGDFKNPWDVTAWIADQGDLPVPVVTALGIDIICAHEVTKVEENGSFLLIVAGQPDWEEMVVNAVVPVRFELCTDAKDGDTRSAAALAHADQLGRIIEMLSDQSFAGSLLALNTQPSSAEIGFTGWAADPGSNEPDGTTDTQIVSKRAYIFEAFLKQ